MNDGWIGVDLDGTLAKYDGWKGTTHIGDPVPCMLDRVRNWLLAGKTVKIFTARVSGSDRVDAHDAIQRWLKKNGLPELEVTCSKDYAMIELWYDRCKQVVPNRGIPVDEAVEFLKDRVKKLTSELESAKYEAEYLRKVCG